MRSTASSPSPLPAAWDWRRITSADAKVWQAHHGKPIARGVYASPVFNQHMSKWCGCCYLVSVVQMLQDRMHVALGIAHPDVEMFPCYRFNMQLALDSYQAHASTLREGWNACLGGSPIDVLKAVHGEKCLLKLSTDAVWLGHPTDKHIDAAVNPDVRLEPIEMLDSVPEHVQQRIFRHGPVVLGVDHAYFKEGHMDASSGVVRPEFRRARNHAVTVVGWKPVGGVPHWIVRNSWGVSEAPADKPDPSCVGTNFNRCEAPTVAWSGDAGYAYLPFGNVRGPPSPWYAGVPSILAAHFDEDDVSTPKRYYDHTFDGNNHPRVVA